MIPHKTFTTKIGDTDLTLEFGKLAPQADVSVLARMGDTVMLTTVVVGGERDLDYFPLSVEYMEKHYASGQIKNSRWVKREGRPTDEAVLKGRVIDRSIRPLFPKSFKRDVQVVCTLLSYDGEHSPDILAGIGSSAVLHISQLPWNGPISLMRVGYAQEEGGESAFIINPTEDAQETSKLDLVVASTGKKVVMIETMAQQLPEALVAEGIKHAHAVNQEIVAFIESIRKEIGLEKLPVPEEPAVAKMKELLHDKYEKEIADITLKNAERDDAAATLKAELMAKIIEADPETDKKALDAAIEYGILNHVRTEIFDKKHRMDGRAMDEIRPLTVETSLIPRAHGSAIFQRGLTQVLSITTLGSLSLAQSLESPDGEESKHYMHHYFNPPYGNGETGRVDGPGRREIGHGALAEKALVPVLPSVTEFPYAIRVVSEVMSSNGSTSMASTCGSTLSLMDAGVPLKAPVAGISIGLMYKTDDDYVLLTDIAGIEDFAGYMDFKVAGTSEGVTAIQLDVKNDGLTEKMIGEIFTAAKTARTFILGKMDSVISAPRTTVSEFAPKVVTLTPPADKIGEIIGPGGKTIKGMQAEMGVEIDVSDDGKVSISGVDQAGVDKAAERIENIYREINPGDTFTGVVTRLLPIGAMVEFMSGREGLVHVSKMSSEFVKDPSDIVQEGQEVQVRVMGVDERGRVNLTMRLDDPIDEDGGGRGGDRGGTRGGYGGGRGGDRGGDRFRRDDRPRFHR